MTTADTPTAEILELGNRWVAAERAADIAALDALTTPDFTLVGPLGFVLDKAQWLDRYRTGAFVTHELEWTDVDVRGYGGSAVAIGRHTQRAAYQGNAADGAFRATHIAVPVDGRWLLAGMHLSPMAGRPSGAG